MKTNVNNLKFFLTKESWIIHVDEIDVGAKLCRDDSAKSKKSNDEPELSSFIKTGWQSNLSLILKGPVFVLLYYLHAAAGTD